MRDIRGPQCGLLRLSDGTYVPATPATIITLRNPWLEPYFAARLRGEHPPMPQWDRWAQPVHPFDDML